MTDLGVPLARGLLPERNEHVSMAPRQRQTRAERHGQYGEPLGRPTQGIVAATHGRVDVHQRRPVVRLHDLERGALLHHAQG